MLNETNKQKRTFKLKLKISLHNSAMDANMASNKGDNACDNKKGEVLLDSKFFQSLFKDKYDNEKDQILSQIYCFAGYQPVTQKKNANSNKRARQGATQIELPSTVLNNRFGTLSNDNEATPTGETEMEDMDYPSINTSMHYVRKIKQTQNNQKEEKKTKKSIIHIYKRLNILQKFEFNTIRNSTNVRALSEDQI